MHIPYASYAIFSRTPTPKTREWQHRLKEHLSDRWPTIVEGSVNEAGFLIVLGGDGTFLDLLRSYPETRAHVLACNTGHEGFLCSVRDEGQFVATLDAALTGTLVSMQVPVLQVICQSQGERRVFRAVNDVLLERTMTWLALKMEIVSDEALVWFKTMQSSGVCTCSAIGSTSPMAVHLSAPRMDPSIRALYVKGINERRAVPTGSIISAATERLRITLMDVGCNTGIPAGLQQPPSVFVDGIYATSLMAGDTIEIAYASQSVTLLRVPGDTHWDRLRSC